MTEWPMNSGDKMRGEGFDLEERTARFGEAIIALCKKVPVDPISAEVVGQLVRSATSIGANYCEADEAESGKEFRYRIAVCKREARETKHQVRMVAAAEPALRDDGRLIWQEAKELTLIFAAIIRKYDNG